MKLGLKYYEAGFGGSSLPALNGGSWDKPANFPTDLNKILRCASISEDDANSIGLGFKYIPEGLLILAAKRMSLRGKVMQAVQGLWIFVPEGADINGEMLWKVIEDTSAMISDPMNFTTEKKFESSAPEIYRLEFGTSNPSVISSGDMKGAELGVLCCTMPQTVASVLDAGNQSEYLPFGLIVINQTGVNTSPAPTVEPRVFGEGRTPIMPGMADISQVSNDDELPPPPPAMGMDPINPDEEWNFSKEELPPPIPGYIQTPEPVTENSGNRSPAEQTKPSSDLKIEYQKGKKSKAWIWVTALVLILVVGTGAFVWFYLGDIYNQEDPDANVPRMFSIVNVKMRSSKMAGSDYNMVTSIPAGSEVIVYEDDGEWATAKFVPPGQKDISYEGYVSLNYLLDRRDFYLLESIFGDNGVRDELATAKVRKGLIEYYDSKGITGVLPEEMAEEVDLYYSPYDQWQVYLYNPTSEAREIKYKKAYDTDSKYSDLAVIIENTSNGRRRLLYFTYDDDETPHLRGEFDYTGRLIKDFNVRGNKLEVTDKYGDKYTTSLRTQF